MATMNGDPWPNTRQDYELLDVIGHGATAIVQSALCKSRQEKCAIKRINLEKTEVSFDELLKEIHAMSQCKHENVMSYHTSFVVKDELWVVMKLCAGGSMLDIIRMKKKRANCKNGVFDEVTIATVLKEALKGLEYLHKNGQLHRDIKAGNILLDEDGSIYIADFGVSAWVAVGKDCSRGSVRHTFVGTPCWMAPEVMEQCEGYDLKADIWSTGITAIELATGKAPYCDMPPMKVLMMTMQNDPPNLDTSATEKNQYKGYSKVFRKFINDCLQKNPALRPPSKQLLKHDFFKKAKDRSLLRKLFQDECTLHAQRVKRAPGSSGHFHKNDDGEWVWSDDDEMEDDMSAGNATITKESKEKTNLATDEQSTLMRNDSKTLEKATLKQNGSAGDDNDSAADDTSTDRLEDSSVDDVSARLGNLTAGEEVPVEENASATESQVINLVLRVRDDRKKLHDIKFGFTPGVDSYSSIAYELVEANLLDPLDMVVVAANIQNLVENSSEKEKIVFPLNSGCGSNGRPCSTSLVGFALLSIASPDRRQQESPESEND